MRKFFVLCFTQVTALERDAHSKRRTACGPLIGGRIHRIPMNIEIF
jgi:hypothetical protein